MPIDQPHAITMGSMPSRRHGMVCAREAQNELDRQQQARQRHDGERPPFREDDALQHHAAERLRGQRDLDAVPQEDKADCEPDEIGDGLEKSGAARRQCSDDDVDANMGALAMQRGIPIALSRRCMKRKG